MGKRITWLIVIRLLLVTTFLSIGTVYYKIDRSVFYIIIASVYLLSLIYLIWLVKKRYLKTLLITQLLCDCVLETLIVYLTGSVDSIFTVLYLLTVVSASISVSPVAGMLTTACASFLYLVQLLAAVHGWFPFVSVSIKAKDISLITYTAHLNIVTFLLVGLLSTLLSRRLHQMEQRVKEKERTSLMGELAAQIAHEIRNPLATISGSIEILEETLRDKVDPKDANLMKAIVTESARVSSIFEQFLDFSKLDMLNIEKVSMHTIIDEIDLLLANMHFSKKISVRKEYSDAECMCECDIQRLKQVFWNIVRNAIEAMPGGGTLTIKTREEKGIVIIDFIDSGSGIEKNRLKEIFVPFKTTKIEGSGIGLVVANRIVEKHGGSIRVSSKKSEGTTFTVILPKLFEEE